MRAIDHLNGAISQGIRKPLIHAPTGAGKTIISCKGIVEPYADRGSTVWFVAPRKQLITQTSSKLDDIGIREHGILQGNHWRFRRFAKVQVASIQTLSNRHRMLKHSPDVIIVDECHHVTAENQLGKIIAAYPHTIVVGLTATPCRMDGHGLGNVFEHMITVASIRELIDQGYLVLPRLFVGRPLDLSAVSHDRRRGDYNQKQLGNAVDKKPLIGNIVQQYIKSGEGQPAVVFAVNVAHSHHIVEEFSKAETPAAHIDGKTPDAERQSILNDLEHGRLKVCSSCQVFTEGFDMPAVGCVIFARPTESLSLYIQMAGRGLRPKKGIAEPGEYCIFLDHAGLTHQHGLVTQDREWKLETGLGDVKAPSTGICPSCQVSYVGKPMVCPNPECKAVLRKEADEGEGFEVYIPEGDDTELVEYSEEQLQADIGEQRRKAFQRYALAAKEKGHKPVSVNIIFKGMFGEWPKPEDMAGSPIKVIWSGSKRQWEFYESSAQTEMEFVV